MQFSENSTLETPSAVSNQSVEIFQDSPPLCINANPYVMKNDGWIPIHIWIAPRHWYSYLAIYMTVLTTLCCILNGIVVVATIKYKVGLGIK